MRKQTRFYGRVALAITLLLSLTPLAPAVQDGKKMQPTGTPVLWRDPGDISSRNLLAGPGGDEMKPDISNITFIEEETGGYSPKFRVKDGAGKIWVAKLGKESQPETASTRLAWAIGYVTEINYLFPCVEIRNAPVPKKDVQRCGENGFTNVRFEARPEGVKRLDPWGWSNNPFVGTREFKGLILLMALINNWDLKDDNNKILSVPGGEGGQNELHYIISDLGATFGKTGNFISHNRNSPQDFVKSKFVEGVDGSRVKLAYNGKNKGLMSNITVEDARWLGGLLSKLSDQQIGDAFRAGNFSAVDVQLLSQAVRQRINQLTSL